MAQPPIPRSKHFTAFRSAAEEVQAQQAAQANPPTAPGIAEPAPATAPRIVTAATRGSAPADRYSQDRNFGSAGVRELGTPGGAGVSHYSVRFYNEISDSTGNANHVCQREIEIATGLGEDEAIALAIMEFEKLENTSSWTTHAKTIECTQRPDR